ncbi:MAG: hypothetical protein JWO24_2506 [Rhodospirillales bacterium]|jgi:hypothetical protein|nr:hypothetical protein [Rhodospirillales bacterium]
MSFPGSAVFSVSGRQPSGDLGHAAAEETGALLLGFAHLAGAGVASQGGGAVRRAADHLIHARLAPKK